MPQPKKPSSGAASSRGARAASPRAKSSPARAKSSAARTGRAKPKAATSSPRSTAQRSRSTTRRPSSSAPPRPARVDAREEALRANLAVLRDLLRRGVVLTSERVQESLDDAVSRGRITRDDATELAQSLLNAGRQQTQDILADVEQLLGRGRSVSAAAGDRVLQHVDRGRRAAGIGSFPILRYDDLSASQISDRLGGLTPAQLRKIRDHERRNQQRKTILAAIERRLK
jgi:hypothetical protein